MPWHAPSSASSSAAKPKGSISPRYPGELGKRIYESVSKEAWQQWLKHQTMLVNENRLNLADQRAREYLKRQMESHFFGSGADAAAGYVPPTSPEPMDPPSLGRRRHAAPLATLPLRRRRPGQAATSSCKARLPGAWAGRAQWRVLETGFGCRPELPRHLARLAHDPQRPRLLHFAAVRSLAGRGWRTCCAASPPTAAALGGGLASHGRPAARLPPPVLRAGRAADAVRGRRAAMLREQALRADTLFLDGFDPGPIRPCGAWTRSRR